MRIWKFWERVPQPLERPDAWERVSHWRVEFAPQGFVFAVFNLLPDAKWEYAQPDNPDHETRTHENLEPLMAQCELDWVAHRQVLRQADEHVARYNGRWVLPRRSIPK